MTLAAVRSHEAVYGVEAAFNFVFAVGLVSLIVSSTETFPTSIRLNNDYEILKTDFKLLKYFVLNQQSDWLGSNQRSESWGGTGRSLRL